MREFPVEQREVVVMKVWGEMTLEEMAQVLEIPVNTVASQVSLCAGKPSRALAEDFEDRN